MNGNTMKTVFLSDIHIGTDAPTNLYQSSTGGMGLTHNRFGDTND